MHKYHAINCLNGLCECAANSLKSVDIPHFLSVFFKQLNFYARTCICNGFQIGTLWCLGISIIPNLTQ